MIDNNQMSKRRAMGLFAAIFLVWPAAVLAEVPVALDVSVVHEAPVVSGAALWEESRARPQPEWVLDQAREGRLALADERSINRGIGADPVWLVLRLNNPDASSVRRVLSAEVGWLDLLEGWLFDDKQLLAQGQSGDRLPVDERPLQGRFPRLDFSIPPGESWLVVRAETPDPMLLALFLATDQQLRETDRNAWLTYGFVYGAVVALGIYNLVLFLALRQLRFGLFALYLASFLFMNLAYTGIGMELFWPQATSWQQWAPPRGMTAFVVSGLLFGANFLSLRKHHPDRFMVLVMACVLMPLLVVMGMASGRQALALTVRFVFIPLFSLMMLGMGVSALGRERRVALLFLSAVAASIITATITAATVAGPLPYTQVGFHAVEYGMVIDAILLALALAEQVRGDRLAMREAQRAAHQDPLTGVANRRGFDETAGVIWQRVTAHDRPLSALMLDIDHFKQINDTHGHAVGDRVLRKVAAVIAAEHRGRDLIARVGGEEFVVLLEGCELHEALTVAERHRRAIGQAGKSMKSLNAHLTVSIGVAARGEAHLKVEDLVSDADQALYQAKEEGRNRVCQAGASSAPVTQ